jgi:hypothetical protein
MMKKNFQIKDLNSTSLINFRDSIAAITRRNQTKEESAEKKEAHPVDAKSLNKPIKSYKKSKKTRLQELSGNL